MRSFLYLVLALAATAAVAAPKMEIYSNDRYGYAISYPPSLLKAQPEADSGDGRVFSGTHSSAEFRVYAEAMVEGIDDSAEAIAKTAEEDCPGHHASYRIIKPKMVAISCEAGAKIIYQKTLLHDGLATTLTATYPTSEKAIWNPIVATMAASMTAGHFLN
jgi:hypothetical protein